MRKCGFPDTKLLKEDIIKLIESNKTVFEEENIKITYRFITIKKRVSSHEKNIVCVVLNFLGATLSKVPENCKDFSFLLYRKNGSTFFIYDGVIKKIKKLLAHQKNRKHRWKRNSKGYLKNNFIDYFKYLFLGSYAYKDKVFGMDINIVRLIIVVIFGLLIILLSVKLRYDYFLQYGRHPIW